MVFIIIMIYRKDLFVIDSLGKWDNWLMWVVSVSLIGKCFMTLIFIIEWLHNHWVVIIFVRVVFQVIVVRIWVVVVVIVVGSVLSHAVRQVIHGRVVVESNTVLIHVWVVLQWLLMVHWETVMSILIKTVNHLVLKHKQFVKFGLLGIGNTSCDSKCEVDSFH